MEGILTPLFMTAFPLCRQIQPKSSPIQPSQDATLIFVSASPRVEPSEPTL